MGSTHQTGNGIIDALPAQERERLLSRSERAYLEAGAGLFEPSQPARHVYFPIDMLGSLIAEMRDGKSVEFAAVGRDGLVGAPVYLGSRRWPVARGVCQVSGEVIRTPADTFEAILAEGGKLEELVKAYTLNLLSQTAITVACNRLHSVLERLARWLLLADDSLGREHFELTQEFIAKMLGVRRASVTGAISELERAGAIEHRRGRVAIADRDRLEAAACECFETIRVLYESQRGGPPVSVPSAGP